MSQSHITTETSSESTERHQTYEDLVDQLVEAMERYHSSNRKRLAAGLTAGSLLLKAKERVKHGDFLALLERIKWSPRQAQRYTKLARHGATTVGIVENGGVSGAIAVIDRALAALTKPRYVNPCPHCQYAQFEVVSKDTIREDRETWAQVKAKLKKGLNEDGNCRWHLSGEEQLLSDLGNSPTFWQAFWQALGNQAGTA